MCGITGIYHFDDPSRTVDAEVLTGMTRSLAHRGPDGEGVWIAPGIGLGHRRLAILDLSDQARQPMVDGSGNFVIVHNGELYNFRELRVRLEGLGHVFRTTSDTEVLLAAYRQWGESVVEKISGIFAFAVWDVKHRRLFLARDAIGVKPLFYSEEGKSFRFGSEIKAILSDPAVGREFDEAALDAFLTFSYTPAPATGFRQVRQLLPGHCAIVDRNGFSSRRYFDVPYGDRPRAIEFDTARAEFSKLIDRITREQMVSDVPIGAFLSGGLDSAAVLRSMKRADLGPVHALTVGFREQGFDEREAARETAAHIGVQLDEQELRLDAASRIAALSRHVEEPTADSSMLPLYLLCERARKRFTVAMAGDGADELLAGYETYRATALADSYRRLPRAMRRRMLALLVRSLPLRDRKYGWRQVAGRFLYGAELGPGRDHCAWRVVFDDALKRRLYTPVFRDQVEHCDPIGEYAAHVAAVPPQRDRLTGLLNADTAFYLPNDMLVKVDRMSMANGLEVRVPFLDVEMVRYVADLPSGFKLHRGRVRKHILRESLRDSLPPGVLRRPKSGFNIPIQNWMRESLHDLLFDAVSTSRQEIGRFLDLRELERVASEHRERRADHAHALFTVLMFALWLDNAKQAWRFKRNAKGDRELPELLSSPQQSES